MLEFLVGIFYLLCSNKYTEHDISLNSIMYVNSNVLLNVFTLLQKCADLCNFFLFAVQTLKK